MLDRRTLPLSGLRAFEAAGRHLHLGRAGEELGVTHGAISHQVRSLEERLGVELFLRANNRLKLTSAGERLLSAVGDGFDRIIEGALHLDPDSLTGRLIIGCSQTIAASWLVRHINDFQLNYPQIEIHVVEVKPQQREVPPEVDVAICYGEPSTGKRVVERLATPQVYPVCSPRILHGKQVITRPEHLTRMPLLHDEQNSWADWFTAMDVPMPRDVRQVHFFSANLSLTAARLGYGVALGNPFEIREDLRQGQLVQLLERGIPESSDYFLLSDSPERQSLRARLFAEWMKKAFWQSSS